MLAKLNGDHALMTVRDIPLDVQAWLTPAKVAASFSSSIHSQFQDTLNPENRIDANPGQHFKTPKKPDGSQKHTADSSLHQNGAFFQTQQQTTSDSISPAESRNRQAASCHSGPSSNGNPRQSSDACHSDSVASNVIPGTFPPSSNLASADSHAGDQSSTMEYASIGRRVSSITRSNERSATSPSKENVFSHGADSHATSQHSTPGNTTVSIECSDSPAQIQDESLSLAQGWALHTSGTSSRRAEDSAASSLDPYLMRHLCLNELELLWDDNCSKVGNFCLASLRYYTFLRGLLCGVLDVVKNMNLRLG